MDPVYLAHFLNGFLMIAIPIGLAVFLVRTWKLGWRIWFVGAAVFILSQVGHIPFNALMTLLLNKTSMIAWPKETQTIFNCIFLGLSAGIFEEFSRYAMYRWWLKDVRSWRKGILVGVGHGGAEAIILGGIALVAFFQLSAYRNIDLATIVPSGQLELARAQVSAYWSTPWFMALLGMLERILTIPIQIALSLIVLQAFLQKRVLWVWLAVIFHAMIDALAVYVLINFGTMWTEVCVFVFTILSLLFIFVLHTPEPSGESILSPEVLNAEYARVPLQNVEETSENLDASKYQ